MPAVGRPDARPSPNTPIVWGSIAACLLALGFATAWVAQPPTVAAEQLDVTSAVADRTPNTVPPIVNAAVGDESTGAELPDDVFGPDFEAAGGDEASASRSTGATSRRADVGSDVDLGDLIGPTTSAIPEPVAPRPVPVGLVIDSIDVTPFSVRDVGLEDDGQLEVPDETEIGWYRYGATAGRPGATVLAAHVSWNSTTGPFFQLGSVDPGDQIAVALDDGTSRQYEVVERTLYDKDELPRERIWRTSGAEELVLITCGGDFNSEIRRYRQNIVVYAVPVA